MNDTEKFFLESDSEQLARIYHWARARYAAPWATFFAVLLRVAASVGPHVQLPGIIGGRASLNLLCAFVSASGGGKGVSDKVARMAWPTPILELPIGSGEGIAATFKRPDKPDADDEPITSAIFNIPEIDTLAGIASRQGSILLAQLKQMAMGEQLGQSNASKATSRVVAAHSYRCCLSVGAQPGHTGVVFNDTTGGTPQRFLWSPTIDPDMPAVATPDPPPLDTALPFWCPGEDGVVEITYGPAEIAETVIAAHIARQRGEADALDGHAMLTRCKVAAVLALMHHRLVVSDLDWQLSGEVMAVSDRTRGWLVDHARQAARTANRARALATADRDEVVASTKMQRTKQTLLKHLSRQDEMPRNELRKRLRSDQRQHFDAAMADLADEGKVLASETDTMTLYRFVADTDYVSTWTESPPPKQQVSRGGQEVPVDHEAKVLDLDSRRSPESDTRRPTTKQWLESHLADLRQQGLETVAAFAVYQAGESAGYRRSTIASVASTNPDITVIDRTGGVSVWGITPSHKGYEAAVEWVDRYIDRLPADTAVVDKNVFRYAAAAAGYSWDAARHAAIRSGRIASEPAHGEAKSERIWRIVDADEVTA